MVSAVRSFVKALFVSTLFASALAGVSVAAEPGSQASKKAVSPTEAGLVAALAVRDSVMALRDSACTVEKKSLRSDLEIERAKCENWEQSYNTLKKNNETCAKALAVAVEASQEQAEKQKAKDEKAKEDSRNDTMMRSASMLGSFGLGMLIMWLILD